MEDIKWESSNQKIDRSQSHHRIRESEIRRKNQMKIKVYKKF